MANTLILLLKVYFPDINLHLLRGIYYHGPSGFVLYIHYLAMLSCVLIRKLLFHHEYVARSVSHNFLTHITDEQLFEKTSIFAPHND